MLLGDGPERDDGAIADDGFFDRGQGLERRQQAADVLRAADQRRERAQLLGKLQKDFILMRQKIKFRACRYKLR